MKTGIRLTLLLTLAFTLSFSPLSPARADDPPPADITTLQRVKDIASGATSSNPTYMTAFEGDLYYAANANTGFGIELHRLNNPSPIDIFPGADSSSPAWLVVYDGDLYFSANGGDGAGMELWKYDTLNGAVRITDIYPGSGGSYPSSLAVFNQVLYFSAQSPGDSYRLWKYDPVSGEQLVDDFGTNLEIAFPESLVTYNNELYLSAYGTFTNDGRELWRYNPAGGVHHVADICPGINSSEVYWLTVYNNALYFSADGCGGGERELWMYDPLNGAQMAADISLEADSSPSSLRVYNGALYFSADGGDNTGQELWKYDPVNGADRVADIFPGPAGSQPLSLAVFNNALFFSADGNDGYGRELWMYNTTTSARLRPTKSYEGWLLESSENSSLGGTLNTNAATLNLGDDAQDRQYRSILSFNTSVLPDNAVIVSASLKIHQQGLTGTNPFTTHGNILIDIFKGAFSGNNTLQTSDFQSAPSKAAIGTIKNLPDINNWYTSILSKSSYSFFNTNGVTQLRLRFSKDDNDDLGADFLRFFSADSASMSDFPMLEVKYYIP